MPWYLSRAGQVVGPIDDDAMIAQLDAGEISGNDRLARPGDRKWQSPAQLFPERFPGPGRASRGLVVALLVLFSLGCWALLAGMMLVFGRVADTDQAVGLGIVLVAACAGLLLLAVAAFAWMRWRAPGATGTGLKVVVGVSAVVALPALVLTIMTFRNLVASDEGVDAHRLSLSADGEVVLLGGLGRTLVHDLQALLEDHSGDLVLVLDNGGGMVDAAEAAAGMLRSRGPFTARVEGECASACALLLAAATRIELYTDSRIGLHRPSSVLGGERVMDTEAALKTMVEHLKRAGFGQRALDAVRDTPPEDMVWLEPTTHFGLLPEFQLLDDDGEPVAAELRSTALARALLARDKPEASEMLRLFDLAFPTHVRVHADALLDAHTRQEGIDEAVGRLLHAPFGTALAATSPDVARAWLVNLVKLDEQFEWASPAGACYQQASHPKAERAALSRALEVVQAAADRDWMPWQPGPMPVSADAIPAAAPDRPFPVAFAADGPGPEADCASMLHAARTLSALPDERLLAALSAGLE